MNIAIITPSWLPMPNVKGGGVESQIQHIIDHNEISCKFNITVFSIYDIKSKRTAKNYKYTKFVYIRKSHLKYYICAVIRRLLKIDLKYNSSFFISKVVRYLKRHQNYEKIIIENNNTFIEPVHKSYKGDIYYHIHTDDINIRYSPKELIKLTDSLRKCKKVISVSRFIKCRIETSTKYKNVSVLKNCIDLDKFSDENNINRYRIRKHYGISDDEIVIMYSGRVIREKGVKELIAAFKNIDSNKPLRLVIVGCSFYSTNTETDYMVEVKNMCRDIINKVIFTGYIESSNMPLIYSMSDINVVPTLYFEEAAGLVAIEAMAMKKPLIISNSGGLPEYTGSECAICLERDNSFIRELTFAMEKLINNDELRESMGEEGFKLSKRFNVKTYYNNFLKILTESEEEVNNEAAGEILRCL